MASEAMEAVMERWTTDPDFRKDLRSDLEGAIRGAGLELSEQEWGTLRAVDWSLSDEELGNRASKLMMCLCT